MNNQSNFHLCEEAHKTYFAKPLSHFDSALTPESTYTGACQIGTFSTSKASIPALVLDGASTTENWRIINIPNEQGYRSIAVLGAVSDSEAKDHAIMHFKRDYAEDKDLIKVIESSSKGLARYLNDDYFTSFVLDWKLKEQQDVLTTLKPTWGGKTGIALSGAYPTASSLLHEMTKNDDYNQLLTPYSELAEVLEQLKVQSPDYDSIYTEYGHLDFMGKSLHEAMKNAQGSLTVKDFEVSKPFKRFNVTQVAVMYHLDDGQTLTIFFHNPDKTPAKLTKNDVLISWRFLLNKRDVTAVIQPNQGQGISSKEIAGRMMKLADQNSARFKRTQLKKVQQETELQELQKSVASKESELQQLDETLKDLEKQLLEKQQGKIAVESVISNFQEYKGLITRQLINTNTQSNEFSNAEKLLTLLNFKFGINDQEVTLLKDDITLKSASFNELKTLDSFKTIFDETFKGIIVFLNSRELVKKYFNEKSSKQKITANPTRFNLQLKDTDNTVVFSFGINEQYKLYADEKGLHLTKDNQQLVESELASADDDRMLRDAVDDIYESAIIEIDDLVVKAKQLLRDYFDYFKPVGQNGLSQEEKERFLNRWDIITEKRPNGNITLQFGDFSLTAPNTVIYTLGGETKVKLQVSEETTVNDVASMFDDLLMAEVGRYFEKRRAKKAQEASNPVSPYSDDDTLFLQKIIDGEIEPMSIDFDEERILHLSEIDATSPLIAKAMEVIKSKIDQASA